jgi:hypothetical protein
MEQVERLPNPGATRIWIGVGLLAVIVAVTFALTPERVPSAADVRAATAAGALGVLGMAAVLAPVVRHRRWAHWASACVLAVWTLAGPAIAGTPEIWRAEVRPMLWFMPWFVLTTAGNLLGTGRGACATHGTRGGWALVGASALFGGILMFAVRIGVGR